MRTVSAALLFIVAASVVAAQQCTAPGTNVFDIPATCGIANQCKANLCACTGSKGTFPTCLAANSGSCAATQACFATFAACLMTTTAARTNTSDPCATAGSNLYIAQLAAAASSTFNTTNLAMSCSYATCQIANSTGGVSTCVGSAINAAVCNPTNLIGSATTATPGTPVVYDIVVTLRISGGNWSAILADPVKKAQAIAALSADLAKLLGVDVKYVTILDLQLGSLVVSFAVLQGSGKSPAQLQTSAVAASGSSAWLTSTQAVYSTVSSETLTTLSVTVTATGAPTTLAPGQTAAPGNTPAPTSSAVSAAGVWAVAAVAALAALWA
jgi:hypothetical protein